MTLHPTVDVYLQVPYDTDIYVHEVLELDERVSFSPFGFDGSYTLLGDVSSVTTMQAKPEKINDPTPPPCKTQAECTPILMNETKQVIMGQVATGEFGKELRAAFESILKNATTLPTPMETYLLV